MKTKRRCRDIGVVEDLHQRLHCQIPGGKLVAGHHRRDGTLFQIRRDGSAGPAPYSSGADFSRSTRAVRSRVEVSKATTAAGARQPVRPQNGFQRLSSGRRTQRFTFRPAASSTSCAAVSRSEMPVASARR